MKQTKSKLYCSFIRRLGGFQWIFKKKKDSLSIILFDGSYGFKSGLFEIRPSWRKPNKYDYVEGWLTFKEVSKWIKELEER